MSTRNKRTFTYQFFSILLQFVLFFFLFNFLYSQNKGTANHSPSVSVHFEFDSRLKARPYRIFLMNDEELENSMDVSLEGLDQNRVKFYRSEQSTYDFYNIKPGIYWIGFSFNVLLKKKINNLQILEDIYIDPGISTARGSLTYNRLEVKDNKRTFVDFIIHLHLSERPQGKDDQEGYFKFLDRAKPKSPEEEKMLDENYFPLSAGTFEDAQRTSSEFFDRIKILFFIHGFDDYLITRIIRDLKFSGFCNINNIGVKRLRK